MYCARVCPGEVHCVVWVYLGVWQHLIKFSTSCTKATWKRPKRPEPAWCPPPFKCTWRAIASKMSTESAKLWYSIFCVSVSMTEITLTPKHFTQNCMKNLTLRNFLALTTLLQGMPGFVHNSAIPTLVNCDSTLFLCFRWLTFQWNAPYQPMEDTFETFRKAAPF